jgi:hypothetical protein
VASTSGVTVVEKRCVVPRRLSLGAKGSGARWKRRPSGSRS